MSFAPSAFILLPSRAKPDKFHPFFVLWRQEKLDLTTTTTIFPKYFLYLEINREFPTRISFILKKNLLLGSKRICVLHALLQNRYHKANTDNKPVTPKP